MLKLTALVALFAVTSVSSVSAMEYQREPTEIRISAAGVDFANAGQVQLFHHRLARAARLACDSNIQGDLGVAAADAKCARESLDRAVAGLNQPLLTAYHAGGQWKMQPVELARAGR